MEVLYAGLPILVVLFLMIVLHWSGQTAGPVGWIVALVVGVFAFGLTPDVFWVSQVKGLLLALFVLAILFPALVLFNLVSEVNGIRSIADALAEILHDRGLLLVLLAWAFSGLLEGLAGFGLPIAIVSPMLIALGVPPVIAVAAVAVGHAWAVTFGDMGVIFQTLSSVVGIEAYLLAPLSAAFLGVASILSGFGSAWILGQWRRVWLITGIGIEMALVQFVFATTGLAPLAAFAAGFAGVVTGVILGRRRDISLRQVLACAPLVAAMASYAGLTGLMILTTLVDPVRQTLNQVVWQASFPRVVTTAGFITEPSFGSAFRFLTHPGTLMLVVSVLSFAVYVRVGLIKSDRWQRILAITLQSGGPAAIGIVSMVGLATLMDHTGMTYTLAKSLVSAAGAGFPVASPFVGMLGAFATGSNNNSNVLFGPLQKQAAQLLQIDPRVLIAAQTTGGSLGSMIAPAKILVGCSTVGLLGQDGEVLKKTVMPGLLAALVIGIITIIVAFF